MDEDGLCWRYLTTIEKRERLQKIADPAVHQRPQKNPSKNEPDAYISVTLHNKIKREFSNENSRHNLLGFLMTFMTYNEYFKKNFVSYLVLESKST